MQDSTYQNIVSIIVITYNSSNYILETLESAKNQTYKNIELIISDDGSSDNTLLLVENWIIENSKYFISSTIIKSEFNTGIILNVERGRKAAHGEWIKFIAGDDLLTMDSIEKYINYITINNEAKVIYASIRKLKGNIKLPEIPDPLANYFYKLNVKQQLSFMIYHDIGLNPPTLFINSNFLENIGGFDKRFKLIEDKPLYHKILTAGEKIYGLNEVTVYYRIHETSLTHAKDTTLPLMSAEYRLYHNLYRKDFLKKLNASSLFAQFEYWFNLKIMKGKPGFKYFKYFRLFSLLYWQRKIIRIFN